MRTPKPSYRRHRRRPTRSVAPLLAGLACFLPASPATATLQSGEMASGSERATGSHTGHHPSVGRTSTPRSVVETHFRSLLEFVEERASLSEEERVRRFDALLEGLFRMDALASRILEERWEELSPRQREDFGRALRTSLRKQATAFLEESLPAGPGGQRPSLEPVGGQSGEERATLEYRLKTDDARLPLELVLTSGPEGAWRVTEATFGEERLVERYRDRVEQLLDDYSFPYMVARLGDRNEVVLEDFEDDPVGELPRGWNWKDSDDAEEKPYRVVEEEGNRYLAARDEGQSVILGKDVEWNLKEYPYISFRVRVHEIPEGGDERYDDRVDSAAGLYFIYRRKAFGTIPESVKYVWSSTLPVGAAVQREGIGRPWQVVFGSGTEGLGTWRTYVFDLREAYRKTFRRSPPDTPIGIGVLSDANSVGGRAYADYDDIRALREVEGEVDSGVREILKPR